MPKLRDPGPYLSTEKELSDLADRFTYHPPRPDQPPRYEQIREDALRLALNIQVNCPPSRERSLAHTKLDEVVMWANAAIARNELA